MTIIPPHGLVDQKDKTPGTTGFPIRDRVKINMIVAMNLALDQGKKGQWDSLQEIPWKKLTHAKPTRLRL